MREVTLAATQMTCDWDREKNVANAIDLFRESTDRGTQIVQIQELFETPYFCADQKEQLFSLAPMRDPSPHSSALRNRTRIIGHCQNAADMERPLSTPRSHVEEAGGRDEIASTTSHSDIRGLLGAEPHDRAPS